MLVLYLARQPGALVHMAADYVSFIILLAGLYVIAGGVLLTGDLEATPLVNTAFLATGSLLASLVGTTGASMLLIRPLLQTNRERARVTHTVVFFIFLVSNIGGMLTPLGDPPLFLGYLQGVPFAWTLRLWGPWLTMTAALLLLYYAWDSRAARARDEGGAQARSHPDRAAPDPRRAQRALARGRGGGGGLPARAGRARSPSWPWPGSPCGERRRRSAGRTSSPRRPMVEVAVLFLGIFLTMIPALELLHVRGGELGVREPWQFFWATGALSSFLDNAPTYLTFLALAQSLGLPAEVVGVPHVILAAISVGAVAMGANTYIGNAPNFMVKAIAEAAGVRMPSFFGYMAYSGAVLLPLFAIVTVLFF